MNDSSVSVANLTKKYGNFKAVDNVSFDLEGTGAFAYLGQNGAGKTTTFKMMTGLITQTAGKVLIDGIDIARERTKALNRIGALIETPEPYSSLSVKEAIQLVGALKNMKRSDILDHMENFGKRVQMPDQNRKVGTLSRGQRARVVFVAAFLGNPEIIFLDEPTNGMDPAERKIIRDVILDWKKDHMILMSSHLLQEVSDTCEEVLLINKGKLVLREKTRELESRYNSKSLKVEYMAPVDMIKLSDILSSETNSVEPQTNKSAIIYFDGVLQTRARILRDLQALGDVITFSEYGSSLEEAFVDLIGDKQTVDPS